MSNKLKNKLSTGLENLFNLKSIKLTYVLTIFFLLFIFVIILFIINFIATNILLNTIQENSINNLLIHPLRVRHDNFTQVLTIRNKVINKIAIESNLINIQLIDKLSKNKPELINNNNFQKSSKTTENVEFNHNFINFKTECNFEDAIIESKNFNEYSDVFNNLYLYQNMFNSYLVNYSIFSEILIFKNNCYIDYIQDIKDNNKRFLRKLYLNL